MVNCHSRIESSKKPPSHHREDGFSSIRRLLKLQLLQKLHDFRFIRINRSDLIVMLTVNAPERLQRIIISRHDTGRIVNLVDRCRVLETHADVFQHCLIILHELRIGIVEIYLIILEFSFETNLL